MKAIAILLVVYLLGLVVVLASTFMLARRENTTHGQAVVGQIGCAIAIQWPLALIWFACVGLLLLARRAFRWLGWLR